jgi:hypothetical protein
LGSDPHPMIFLPSLRFSNGGISAMQAGIRISSLVPSGLVIESVSDSSDSIILAVRSEGGMAECPLCRARSRRIHSPQLPHVSIAPPWAECGTDCPGERLNRAWLHHERTLAGWLQKPILRSFRGGRECWAHVSVSCSCDLLHRAATQRACCDELCSVCSHFCAFGLRVRILPPQPENL